MTAGSISDFPVFTKITLAHKKAIDKFTAEFRPYSDFNFVSLFSWDVDGTAECAMLNKNLVIKLPDYITGVDRYSVLGETDIDETLHTLLATTKALHLVPQIVVDSLQHRAAFLIEPDENNFDYVYGVEPLASLSGSKYKKKRYKANRFQAQMKDNVHVITHRKVSKRKAHELSKVFEAWGSEKKLEPSEIAAEGKAIQRILDHLEALDVFLVEFKVKEKVVAFSINEIINNNYAVCHFEKALLVHDDIYAFIVKEVAKELQKHGCRYVNWEQDLGLPGLKESKLSFQPLYLLEKYTITSKDPSA